MRGAAGLSLERGANRGLDLIRSFFNPARSREEAQRKLHRELRLTLRREIEAGLTRLSALPLGVNIGLHGRGCNISCNMCNFPDRISPDLDSVRSFYRDFIRSLKPELKYFSLIQTGGGEPLVYPELYDLMDAGREWPLLKFNLGTNGFALDEKWAGLICDQNMHQLSISLDAATEEVYREIRGKSDWGRVMRGIELVRRQRKGNVPGITLNFVVLRQNYRQIEEFVELARSVGAQRIIFQSPVKAYGDSLVHGRTDRLTKLEWTWEATTLRDPAVSGEILARLARAWRLMDKYGIEAPYSNAAQVILDYHPYLKGLEEESPQRAGELARKLAAERQGGYAGLTPPRFERLDFGRNPDHVSWDSEEEYDSQTLWIVSLDPEVNARRAVSARTLGREDRAFKIDDDFPNGPLALILEAAKGDDYAVSARAGLVLDQAGRMDAPGHMERMRELERRRAAAGPRFQEYERVPEQVRGFSPGGSERFFCTLPFTNLSIRPDSFHFCCHARAKYLSMPLPSGDVREIWNSDPIREARRHMLEGRGRELVCRPRCPYFKTGYWVSDLNVAMK